VTVTATDDAGNSSQVTFNVTVQDTTPPTVTAPANITIEATGPTTAVSLGTATATDLVDGTLTPTPSDTGPFAVGTTTVTWSATDAHGNTGTATQTVTVSYAFSDFYQPVDNLPVVNTAKGGQSVPIKRSVRTPDGPRE
jgi:hypothetical protein